MKNRFTKLSAVFALLAFLVVPLGMRGQTTETVSLEDGVYETDHITWTCADGNITIQQLKGTSGTAVNSNYISAPRVYKGHYLSFVASNDYTITSISITYNGSYMGNSMTAGTVVSENVVEDNPEDVDRTWGTVNNGTHVVSSVSEDGLEAIYIQNVATATNVQLRPSEISVTYIAGTPAVTHTLTFGANPTEGGTVTVGSLTSPATVAEGATFNISATANSGYLFSNWTVVGAGSSIDETNGTFTMGTEDATLTANFTLVNTYTVTYYANVVGTTPIEEVYNEGEDVTVANNTFTNPGYAFTEWNTNESGTGDSYSPGDVIEDIDDDIELYAQWEESHETVDVLNWAATGSPTNYTDWTYTALSGAAYAGQSSGNATGQYIQLRSNYNNSGIVTTTSIGNVTKVTVTWNSTTVNGRTLNVYGKNTAYSAATDLYGNDAGTLLGTIVCGTSTALNITGNYAYIGLRSANNAMYLDEIDITWETSGTPQPSITVAPATLHVDAGQHLVNYLSLAYENIVADSTQCFTVHYCNAQGEEIELVQGETWMIAGVVKPNDFYQVLCTIMANEGDARTAYFKVSAQDAEDNTVYSNLVTVIQDAPVVEMTIAEARAQEVGDEVHTSGIITSISGNGTKTAYMQDATAAIVVYGSFTAAVGDSISVSGTLSDFNGLLEITSPQVTVISSGNTIEPTLMTIEQINASTNQGWYIRIENATVTAINGQNTTIAQVGDTIVVRGISGVTLSENDIISLNGNIGCFNVAQIANPTDVEVAVSGFAYQYSINGVLGSEQHGTQITLSNGTAVGGLAFAGWTLDPDDVENILAAGSPYVLEEDGVVFYAVYSRTVASGSYVRVTETPDDWSGNYLIVNKNYGVAFNGALQPLDVVNNTISVSAYGNNVSATFETNAGIFTITPTDGDSVAIKSASGLYIGQNSDANGMLTSTETVYNNTISFGGDTVNIVGKGGAYLRYNKASNQNRFRYYKTSSYTGQQPIQLYKQEGEITTTSSFYTRVFANETATADITIVGPSIIPSGDSLTMWDSEGSYSLINDLGAEKFIIEDGAQLYYYNSVLGTMQKNIDACSFSSGSNDGYYLITTPIDAYVPSAANGFLTTNYDLYAYDATEDMEWRNYKADEFSSLAFGKGYLYANGENTTLQFAGMLYAEGMCIENLAYVENDGLKSLNLVGNPYTWSEKFCLGENGSTMGEAPVTNFLTLNSAGNGFIVTTASTFTAQPLQGFFVQATAEGQLIMETGAAVEPGLDEFMAGSSNLNIQIDHNNNLVDNAIVNFGNGSMLKKFYLSNNNTRVYIPQGSQDYAVVRSANEGEMPINFKAENNGNYTISVNAENLEMNYLHLIDNMTGADVDLLVEPNYSFEAKTTDYASRFKLVFSANNTNENNNESFAYFNGSEWSISNIGEGTLQVIDVTGRIVSSKTVNGNATLTTDNLSAGVYVMRLMNGNDVKTQKVVIR